MALSIYSLLYMVLIPLLSTLPIPRLSHCLPFFLPNSLPYLSFLILSSPLVLLFLLSWPTHTYLKVDSMETCGVCLFWVCFISRSIMISSSLHFPLSPGISFSFIEKWNSIVCVYHILVVHSADGGHRGGSVRHMLLRVALRLGSLVIQWSPTSRRGARHCSSPGSRSADRTLSPAVPHRFWKET